MSNWLVINGEVDLSLQKKVEEIASNIAAREKFSAKDVKYISTLRRNLLSDEMQLTEKDYVQLRELCRLSDISIAPLTISSHRPIVGKVIVLAKRAVFPLVRQLLGGFVKEQRAWNAKLIEVTAQQMARISALEKNNKSL